MSLGVRVHAFLPVTARVCCRTVLLMNPGEVPADFLSVAEQLSCVQYSQKETYITLIKHCFQSALGTKYPLQHIHRVLQVRPQQTCPVHVPLIPIHRPPSLFAGETRE